MHTSLFAKKQNKVMIRHYIIAADEVNIYIFNIVTLEVNILFVLFPSVFECKDIIM